MKPDAKVSKEPTKREFLLFALNRQGRSRKATWDRLSEHFQKAITSPGKPRINLSSLDSAERSEVTQLEAGLSQKLNKECLKSLENSVANEISARNSLNKQTGANKFLSQFKKQGPQIKKRRANESKHHRLSQLKSTERNNRSNLHDENCWHREKEYLVADSVKVEESSAFERKHILRSKFPNLIPAIDQEPDMVGNSSRSKTCSSDELDTKINELDSRIFYYKFYRHQELLENKEKIMNEMKQKTKEKYDSLSVTLKLEAEECLKNLMVDNRKKIKYKQVKSRLGLPPLKELLKKQVLKRSDSEDQEPMEVSYDKNVRRSMRSKRAPLLIQFKGDLETVELKLENPYEAQPTAEDISKQQKEEQRQNEELNRKSKRIWDELEGINKSVEENFMICNNNNRKIGKKGVITVDVIDYLNESLKHIDKIRELDATMLGLYTNLQEIGFFKMFRMKEACQIFSWCKMTEWEKGKRLKYMKRSNVIVILRGRITVNDPGEIEYDSEGRVIVESYKISIVKNGLYDNIHFTMIDGDYITPNVFKFMNRKRRC